MQLAIITVMSFVVARLSISAGWRLGLVDHPDSHKVHQGAIPLTGGVSIFLTILLGTLLLGIEPYKTATLIIALMVFAIGVFDDVRHLNPWLRLAIQYGAGICLATFDGVAIHNVGTSFRNPQTCNCFIGT